MLQQIFIRVDSTASIGMGHVMRCLTLAKALQKRKFDVMFICREESRHVESLIIEQGLDVHFLKRVASTREDAEHTIHILREQESGESALVVDHYAFDRVWEEALRPYVARLMVIDDLANRPHTCDILLDQNYYPNASERYRGLVPESCTLLLGPAYALLREEFLTEKPAPFHEKVERILVTFGGSDPSNMTGKILDILVKDSYRHCHIDVVVGSACMYKHAIKIQCEAHSHLHYHEQIDDMARLMAQADICIGAGGTTSWERLALGRPSLVFTIADNQLELAQSLADKELIRYAGSSEAFSQERFIRQLEDICNDLQYRKNVPATSARLVEGSWDGAGRVCEKLLMR